MSLYHLCIIGAFAAVVFVVEHIRARLQRRIDALEARLRFVEERTQGISYIGPPK